MQDTSTSTPSDARGRLGVALSHVRARPVVVSLAAVLLVALLARSYIYGAVFRDEAVVFLANDPYYYRFVVERHVASAGGDFGALLRYEERDPFLVVALALCVSLLGGVETAPLVLAWYPVVVGVATVALVYVLARLVSSSRLVGVVAAATDAAPADDATRCPSSRASRFSSSWASRSATARISSTSSGSNSSFVSGSWVPMPSVL